MLTAQAYCILIGENFNPDDLEKKAGLKFRNKEKKGDIGKSGRYKDQFVPYGSAILEGQKGPDSLDFILDALSNNYSYIQEYNVEDILLTLNLEYEGQCNWEFSNKQLKSIVEMNINFSLSCYEKEN